MRTITMASEEYEAMVVERDRLRAENERMRKALRYEQHLAEHIGTNGQDCWAWGPAHYMCLKRRYQLVNLCGYVEVME